MQKIPTSLKRKSLIVVGIVATFCCIVMLFGISSTLSITNEPDLTAQAATVINASNIGTLRSATSGEYELNSDITISASSGLSTNSFSGTFDGKNHTITINGSIAHSGTNNTDNYVGALFGQLNGGTVKNLKIVLNGNISTKFYNNLSSSSYDGGGSSANKSTYLGLIAGICKGSATIDNVEVTIGDNGVLSAIGRDNGSNHETQSGGSGGYVGALFGTLTGVKTFKNITVTNNGSIWARSQNVSAGQGYKGSEVKLVDATRIDKAAAGGVVGAVTGGGNNLAIDSLVLKGNGYVGAKSQGGGDKDTSHNINFAGGVIGYCNGSSAKITLRNVLYSSEVTCYVAVTVGNGTNYRGVILGGGDGVTVANLYRRLDDNSKEAGLATYTGGSDDSGGASKSTIKASAAVTHKIDSDVKGVDSLSTDLTFTNLRQYSPTIYYGTETNSSLGSSYVTDIKDGYICIYAYTSNASYIISAAAYRASSTASDYVYKNYYTIGSVQATTFDQSFKIPASSVDFRVMLATTSTAIYSGFHNDISTKTYNLSGIRFTGSTSSQSEELINDLFWGSFHNTDESLNTYGSPNSPNVTTHANVGTYTFKLCRMDENTGKPVVVENGTSLGADQENAPKTIYKYDTSRTYTCSITPAELILTPITNATFTREYTGDYNVLSSDLKYTTHYTFKRADNGQTPTDTPEFKVGDGAFYDSTGSVTDASVGENKVVKLFDIEVFGNYVLSNSSPTELTLTNCSITPKTVVHSWSNLTQTYNGQQILPTISATGMIGSDTLNFKYEVFDKVNDPLCNTPLTGITYVGDYTVRATINGNTNYRFATNSFVTETLTVTTREISLSWTNFSEVFNYTDKEVTVWITDEANTVPQVDRGKIDINVVYYLDGSEAIAQNQVSLRNAGNYYAIGSISNENYYLDYSSTRFDDISITPITVNVNFHTGSASTVENLPYMGYSYIGDARGLHATLPTDASEYGLSNDNVLLTYVKVGNVSDENNVRYVGTYSAVATLVESPSNAEDMIITNYQINESVNTATITIVEAVITLTYSYDNTYNALQSCYIYDGLRKSINAEVPEIEKKNPLDIIQVKKIETLNGTPVDPKDANDNYLVTFSLSNENYVISPEYQTRPLKIAPYDITNATNVTIEEIDEQTYAGTPLKPAITVWHNSNILSAGKDYDEPQYLNNTNAGTNSAIVTINGKGNYSGSRETRFTILPRTLSVNFLTLSNKLTYNGKNQKIDAEFQGFATESDIVEPQIDYSGTSTTPHVIGNYVATVKFRTPQSNYVLPSDEDLLKFNFEIIPKSVYLIFSDYTGLKFNNANQTINVKFKDAPICVDDNGVSDVLGLSLTYVSPNGVGTPKNAATYTATAELTGEDKANYVISGDKSTTFSIAKYELELEFLHSSLSQNYDATSKAPSYSLLNPEFYEGDAEITLTYKDRTTLSTVVNPTKAGEYIVSARANDTNYMLIGETQMDFVINQAELRIIPLLTSSDVPGEIPSYVYQGPLSPTKIDFNFDYSHSTFGNDDKTLSVKTIYVNENGEELMECVNVGTYQIRYTLAENNDTNKNYKITNSQEVFDTYKFKITPRYVTVSFNISGSITYNGETYVISAESKEVYNNYVGGVNVTGYENNSGIVMDLNDRLENVNYVVDTVDADGNPIVEISNVGTYTSTVRIEGKSNYVLYTGGEGGHKTVSTFIITKKKVVFTAKTGVSKPYGTKDNPENFIQILDSSVTGITNGEPIVVTLTRAEGEDAGSYAYTTFTADASGDNFELQLDPNPQAQHGVFEITKKSITITPKVFEFDYQQAFTSEDLIQTYPDNTAFGPQELKLQLVADTVKVGDPAGTYDLKPVVSCLNNSNYVVSLVENSHKDKIVILGRSIKISFVNEVGLDDDFHITYGDADPDLYEYINFVDVSKCDDRIKSAYEAHQALGNGEKFNWRDYISILCVNDTDQTVRPYKEIGYNVVIRFLDANGLPDDNYRAVRLDGTDVNAAGNEYKLFVNKFDLGTLYGQHIDATKPTVIANKEYDGEVKASITDNKIINSSNPTISDYLREQGFTVIAQYNDANAGINKPIIIRYSFSFSHYENNYVLPVDYELTNADGSSKGRIDAKLVTASFNQESLEITYGEIPSVGVNYVGFLKGDDVTTENILVTTVYKGGSPLTTIQNAGQDYEIVLNVEYLNSSNNYTLEYTNATVYLNVNKKDVYVLPGERFEKPVDGTDRVALTSANYVLDGLIDNDVGKVDIEYVASLSKVVPGETVVKMSINKLIGAPSSNYTLKTTNIEIQAYVKKLADVSMVNEAFDFNNEEQNISVDIQNALEGVSYQINYFKLDGTALDGAPIDAGTYNAECVVILDDYKTTMARAKLTINKIQPSLYFTGNFNQVYGSFTPIKASVKAVGLLDENVKVKYTFEVENEQFPAFPQAGSHIVTAVYEESTNYLEVRGEHSLKIAKKEITVTFDNYKGLVYNGYTRNDDITVRFNGIVEGDTCVPIKLFNVEQVKNAGNYRLEVNPSNDSYMITGTRSINFSIAKKSLSVSVGNDTSAEIGTTPQFNIKYEGFVENESVDDLEKAPTVKPSSGVVGTNKVQYVNGIDENYTFVYVENTYVLTYVNENADKPNYTPYLVIGGAIGGIVLIFILGYVIKIRNFTRIANAVKKREIRNSVMKKK